MRVVSLVPSLTLTLFDLGLDATSIVGRTPWCIHPADQVNKVPVVGGTKTPTRSKIIQARPDLVVLDRDENPKAIYDWCQEQGYATYVCHVKHPNDVPAMVRELSRAVDCEAKGESMAKELEQTLASLPAGGNEKALPIIWHEPLMAANATTYAGGMISCLGFDVVNIDPDGNGYPEVTPASIKQHGIGHLFFSSEPYEFNRQEGEQVADEVEGIGGARPLVHLIDGEALTWMGSHTNEGLKHLLDLRSELGLGDE